MGSRATNDLWTSIVNQSDRLSSIAHADARHRVNLLREEAAELQVLLTEAARIERKMQRAKQRRGSNSASG